MKVVVGGEGGGAGDHYARWGRIERESGLPGRCRVGGRGGASEGAVGQLGGRSMTASCRIASQSQDAATSGSARRAEPQVEAGKSQPSIHPLIPGVGYDGRAMRDVGSCIKQVAG